MEGKRNDCDQEQDQNEECCLKVKETINSGYVDKPLYFPLVKGQIEKQQP